MKKHYLLTLSLLALTATAVQAQDPVAMNIELVGGTTESYLIDDVQKWTFNVESDQMTIVKTEGDDETLDLDNVSKITFGESTTSSSSSSSTALDPEPQTASILVYGTDAVHVSCSDGIKTLTITSVSGTQAFKQNYDAQPTEVVADVILTKGIYVVSVVSQNKRISQKIRIK